MQLLSSSSFINGRVDLSTSNNYVLPTWIQTKTAWNIFLSTFTLYFFPRIEDIEKASLYKKFLNFLLQNFFLYNVESLR